MENKLELKHLAPYLPYGLRIACGSNGTHKEMVVGPISDLETTSILTVLDKQPFLKPLLIPLSELTQDQWIEVFKAGCNEFDDKFSVDVQKDWVILDLCYDISIFDFRYSQFQISRHLPPFNQLAAFNKLFELHADIYGLIEAGLALNKLEHGK